MSCTATADRVVTRVGTLSGAGPDAITFLANPAYRAQLAGTRAAAVILEERNRADCPVACLVHPQPYLTYARIASVPVPAACAAPRRARERRRRVERARRADGRDRRATS